MKRVLVTGGSQIGKAGVASIVYKWGTSFSGEVVYDYLMQRGLPDQIYVDNIRNKGSRIFTMDNRSHSMLSIIFWVKNIVKKYGYETIHINTDSAYVAAAYIYASKWGGTKNIYVHSHCTRIDDNSTFVRNLKTIFHYICRPYVIKNSKRYLACSKTACEWMFGKKALNSRKYLFIENGVEVEKYLFKEAVREKKRKELGISNKYVLGNIGRFSYQKNHEALIDIFFKYLQVNSKAVLLLIGEGELEFQIKNRIKQYKIESKVIILGRRNDVNELLNAMDILVMPSRFEGLPVTAVEAQMTSLSCVLSDNITEEAKFTPNVSFASVQSVKDWVSKIEKHRRDRRPYPSKMLYDSLFNVINSANKLEKVLLK